MANKTQKFRMHEVRRGLLAAKAAGVDNPCVEIHTADGTRFVIGSAGKPDEATAAIPKSGKVRSTSSRASVGARK